MFLPWRGVNMKEEDEELWKEIITLWKYCRFYWEDYCLRKPKGARYLKIVTCKKARCPLLKEGSGCLD